MPTLETLIALAVLILVGGLTRFSRMAGVTLAVSVAIGAIYLWLGGLLFGGPIILVGDVIGLTMGWFMRPLTKEVKVPRGYGSVRDSFKLWMMALGFSLLTGAVNYLCVTFRGQGAVSLIVTAMFLPIFVTLVFAAGAFVSGGWYRIGVPGRVAALSVGALLGMALPFLIYYILSTLLLAVLGFLNWTSYERQGSGRRFALSDFVLISIPSLVAVFSSYAGLFKC